MGQPVILQVVGFQNSGKTTVITQLVQHLTKIGFKTGVIKHHGHETFLRINDRGKDTERHRQAGAFVTGVTSSSGSVLSTDFELTVDQGIAIYEALKMDCILIEGFKNVQLPRVALLQNMKEEQEFVNQSNQLVACISLQPHEAKNNIPYFLREEKAEWTDYLINYIVRKSGKGRLDHETI